MPTSLRRELSVGSRRNNHTFRGLPGNMPLPVERNLQCDFSANIFVEVCMRVITILVIVLVSGSLVFSQKTQNAGLRKNSHSAKLSASPSHGPGNWQSASGAPKTSSSAKELAKIERNSVKSMHKAPQHSAGSAALPKSGTLLQNRNKPIKFSYKPPQSGSTGGNSSAGAGHKPR
jgi:glucose dehydrogenase